jgi:nitroreductase
LINDPIRLKFGELKIKKLVKFLKLWKDRGYSTSDSQFLAACSVLRKYIELHKQRQVDISEIISNSDIKTLKIIGENNQGGVINYTSEDYFQNSNASFNQFSNSRHSVRHFNGQWIESSIIKEVVGLARNSPSVCNRQGFRVKLVNDPDLVKGALKIQTGLNATADTVRQLFVITVDRSVFVSSAEWYQGFIDGGIFLQNILYALHFYKIAAVPLNWSKHFYLDVKLHKLLQIPKSEKIIALTAIGYPQDLFQVPFSKRKEVSELLKIIE